MYKFLFFSLLLCMSSFSFGQDRYKKGDILYVMAPSGLRMRQSPQKGAPMTTIPYGAKVKVEGFPTGEEINKYRQKVDGIWGFWPKVTYDGGTGYVFDGFLSRLPAPALGEGDIKAYLLNHYEAMSETVTRRKYFPEEEQWTEDRLRVFKWKEFVVVYESLNIGWGGEEHILEVRGANWQEMYLLLKAFYHTSFQNVLKNIEKARNGEKEVLCYTGYTEEDYQRFYKTYSELTVSNGSIAYDFFLCECYEGVELQEMGHTIRLSYGMGCH